MLRAILLIIIAPCFWGIGGPTLRLLGLPVIWLAFFRFLIPAIAAWFTLKKTGSATTLGGDYYIFSGSVLNVVKTLAYMFGYTHLSASTSASIQATWPLFVAVFAPLFLGERFRAGVFGAAVVGVVGVSLVSRGEATHSPAIASSMVGILIMIVSALSSAWVTLLFKKDLNRYTPMQAIFLRNAIGAIVMLPFIWSDPFIPSIQQILVTVAYSFFIGYVAFIPYYTEVPTPELLMGTGLIILSVTAVSLIATRKGSEHRGSLTPVANRSQISQ